MKRVRDEAEATAAPSSNGQAVPAPSPVAASTIASSSTSSSSPHALHFEVIYSITSRRSGSLEAERAAVLSRLLGSAAAAASSSSTAASPPSALAPTVAAVAANVSALLEDELSVCLGGRTRELVYQQLLHSSEEGSLLRLLTVELVANDGRTLVLASPQTHLSGGAPSTTAPPPLLIDVAGAEASEEVVAHPADLLLLRCQPRKPVADGETATTDAATAPSSSAATEVATHVEFVTFNTALFTAQDVDLWREAVHGSVVVVVRWLSALLEQPPGLAQLAFLEAAASSLSASVTTGAKGIAIAATEGWRRALQLPLLLRVKPEVMRSADMETLDRLRRTIVFALETILGVFLHVESAMRLPRLCQRLVYLFLASPLFVDGASQVSMQLIATDAVASTRQSIAQTLQSCVQMGLQYASAAAALMADAAASTAELRRSVQQARNGYEVVLSRLSHVWLLHSASLKSKRAAGTTTGPEAAICEVLESVAASGVLRQVLRWLQLEEDMRRAHDHVDSSRMGDTADAITELLSPPTLRQLQEGRYLQERTVAEQLTALRRTYNPYLSHELQQFLKGTAVAAYAELYGNTAAAVRRVTKLTEGAAELQHLGRLDGVIAVPLETVDAVGVRGGGLAEYCLTEVQQHAAFGLPVRLNLHLPSGHQQHQLNTLEATLQATRFTSEPGVCRADASLFAYAVVQLNGQWIAFPLVLTQLNRESQLHQDRETNANSNKRNAKNTANLIAHVLRDGDMLADFVTTSAATAENGRAQAWVVVGEEANVHRRTPHRRRAAAAAFLNAGADAPMERLLPSGTPALTYMDCLRRLHALSITVRQCKASTNSSRRRSAGGGGSAVVGPMDRPFDPNSATGLWMEHFMDGVVPLQRYVPSLAPRVASLLSGSGATAGVAAPAAGKQSSAAATAVSLQTLLASVNGTVRFSSAQVEALYSLTAGTGLTASSSAAFLSPPARPGATSSGPQGSKPVAVKVVDGCTGSGKTSILYASGLLRGKLHAAARHEQQRCVQAGLKQAVSAVRQAAEALRRASVTELFATSPEARNGRNPLEEASLLSTEARQQYQRLNEGFLYCSTPFMLRPAAVTSTVPEAVEELLFNNTHDERGDEGGETEAAVWARGEVNSIATLLRESHERSLKAPLAAQLNAQLQLYLATGRWSGRCRAAGSVATPLLALTMSARETADVMASAAATAPSERSSSGTWAGFIAARFWPDSAVADSLTRVDESGNEEEEAGQAQQNASGWEVLTAAPDDRFTPVSMPPTTRLSSLSTEQREGWHSVYLDKQVELAQHVHAAVHESVKSIFQVFLDLVFGVAAASQSTRHALLTATPVELTQGMQLPYLWCWQPSHVCIDDLDTVQDGIFAMLTPASSVVYTLTAEVPAFQERRRSHERVVLALVRSLRTELQRVGALTTTALRESLRCRRAEVETVLRYSTQDSRALAKPLEGDPESEEKDGTEHKDGEEAEQQPKTLDLAAPPPAFPGLASYSAVEVWSHGVPMDDCVAADAAAAVFLMSHISSYWGRSGPATSPLSYGIYTNTAAAAETVSEALVSSSFSLTSASQGGQRAGSSSSTSVVRVWKESLEDMGSETSFAAATNVASVAYTNLEEAECETDVGVVLLSGLLDVVIGALKNNPASHRPDVRQQQWRQLWAEASDGSPSLFVTRLQWWLWRLLRRVRLGVFFIGSREVFTCVPLFAKVESFVRLQRRLLSPKDDRAYWLPAGIGASVLAMVCPDHFKFRCTATVQEREAGDDEVESELADQLEVEVQKRGAEKCLSLCLKPYEGCSNPSHACLQPCHVQRPLDHHHSLSSHAEPGAETHDAAATERVFHACCPYPCGNVLPCGHVCHRICGLPCEPCTFAGLTELSCGQRVVSGMENKVLQYTVFHHFQERRCGEATAPCRTPVSVPCTRCGARTMIRCHHVTAQQARRRNAAAEERAAHAGEAEKETGDGVDSDEGAFVIGETACAGCVALYNKVATKYGYELLPMPPTDLTQRTTAVDHPGDADSHGDEEQAEAEDDDDDSGDAPGASLPRHSLSIEAQAELRREFTTAGKKMELLVMKEALEISSGRATEKTDYAVFRAEYETLKTTQAAQEKAWKDAHQADMDAWATRLRKALTTQYAVNTELDTMMPRLVSDATDEAEVQRLQFVE
ncbi:hypothetical protein ABB37_07582 [Leptomonas pyrrhocoris]|uniref:Uncharacterized protein n=1 Tax=Leptomonas pyrrhocoris TaxID=157538 RepID=A0A0M9FVJ1_LEPPY|nr:hypothetical protein ABB37_07582 [Leptomonas pyrrhocoris]KPA76756.1 hypothetical protein ABB37_07582 [Leptomonas pyrrhocoris]|eukprot:XP_015655195.1 hypothetical protein ABB37_07582 [Leptomonas pyrrhocoris]